MPLGSSQFDAGGGAFFAEGDRNLAVVSPLADAERQPLHLVAGSCSWGSRQDGAEPGRLLVAGGKQEEFSAAEWSGDDVPKAPPFGTSRIGVRPKRESFRDGNEDSGNIKISSWSPAACRSARTSRRERAFDDVLRRLNLLDLEEETLP